MGEVAARTGKPGLIEQLEKVAPQLGRLGIHPDRFVRILVTECRTNRQLLECSPESFLAAAFASAQLGLEPGKLGHFWLIPKKIKGRWEVVPIIGYRGLVELARRAGVIITPGTVYERDHYVEHQGTHPRIDHRPHTGDDPGAPVRWYAVASFPDGRSTFRSLNRAQVEERRYAGSSGDSPAWKNWYDAMSRKTAIRALWAQLPTLPDLADAERIDGQVLHMAGETGHVTVVSTERDVEDSPGEGDVDARGVAAVSEGQPPAEPTGGTGDGGGEGGPSSPDTTLSSGGAEDRQILAIITLQRQRGLDDHDLAELVRDRTGHEADDLDGLLDLLDGDQAGALITELGGSDTDDDGEGGQ